MPSHDAEPAILVQDLCGGYGDTPVLEGVSLSVRRGDIFAILGASGSGKSTLLRHLIGLEQPWSGSIRIAGVEVAGASEQEMLKLRRKIGMLFQGGALFSSMTVAENVGLPLREHTRLDPGAIRTIASMKLGMVHLSGSEDKLPDELSGGMRKRAALARAMALDPEILFFDEPTAGLDPITAAELDELILQINKTLGTTIVLVSHELQSVRSVAQRGALLHNGRALAEGTLEEIRERGGDYARRFFDRRTSSTSKPQSASLLAVLERG